MLVPLFCRISIICLNSSSSVHFLIELNARSVQLSLQLLDPGSPGSTLYEQVAEIRADFVLLVGDLSEFLIDSESSQ